MVNGEWLMVNGERVILRASSLSLEFSMMGAAYRAQGPATQGAVLAGASALVGEFGPTQGTGGVDANMAAFPVGDIGAGQSRHGVWAPWEWLVVNGSW